MLIETIIINNLLNFLIILLKYVSNSCGSSLSNGPIKGINRKIKALKRICYGFKNMNHFYARILLIVK
ncbi:transposase [Liquorilactobacillus nagelii]|uniref:transposase n=1 Tax=Liquorilactobacillus nagelii TaxID=82688 RepID=UPI003C6D961A